MLNLSGRVRSTVGASRVGCLGLVAIALALVYVGLIVLGAEFDYLSIRGEATRQAARALEQTDDDIRSAIAVRADALGLPPSARDIVIMRRPGNVITIRLGYTDTLTFAGRWDWIRTRQLHIEDQF